jgi:hypothetical protein
MHRGSEEKLIFLPLSDRNPQERGLMKNFKIGRQQRGEEGRSIVSDHSCKGIKRYKSTSLCPSFEKSRKGNRANP